NGRPLLVVCADAHEAVAVRDEVQALLPGLPCLIFEDWEILPYDQLSPHQDITSSRLALLARLPTLQSGIVIAPIAAIMSRLCPVDFVARHSLSVRVGQVIPFGGIAASLTAHGYLRVEQVVGHGEFALRGSILDIFPMGSESPYRIDFLDDEVDSIRAFDPETQRSGTPIQEVSLLPAHEFPLDEEGISAFRSAYREGFPGGSLTRHTIYQAISRGAVPAGIEFYLPLFFPRVDTLFDYLPEGAGAIVLGNVTRAAREYHADVEKRSRLFVGNADHPPLPPGRLFLDPVELESRLAALPHLILRQDPYSDEEVERRGVNNLGASAPPPLAIDYREKGSAGRLIAFAREFCHQGGRVLITAQSPGRRESLREILPEILANELGLETLDSLEGFLGSSAPLTLAVAPFTSGTVLGKPRLAVLTESELLGTEVVRRRERSRKSSVSQDAIIKNLAQLVEGQLVVHIDHGIGRYRGLRTLTTNGVAGEYLCIEYARGDLLNIPITALGKIARYSGQENPPLSSLGNETWGRRKQKAQQKAHDVAAELLDLYARREARPGRAFAVDDRALEEFASGFRYEETPDQRAAIDATIADLRQGRPMDRLVCGDVGFGKTEVALRAAFVAAHAGAQVAVLVPTTILAEQHYESFKERFAGTAVIVEALSRFKTAREQAGIISALAEGKIDIIIGTHRLLSKTVRFQNLGLIIVDEEHRFGVRQKERLKELRAEVDLLTLTATPIPRTLNMAMEGMRELSIIATPPEHRLAVKTFVSEASDQVCREAVMRELRRGGQVYYLHNDVSTIAQRGEELQRLVPEAKICIGHGQMSERELQQVMRDFYHQRFNLLLCSTIIENGLDIATANTIIIDRADCLGLAQLHQLRGRVGRSHHQAYAYLFTPPRDLLGRDAQLRLEAIATMEELGAGFVLATHDMEIRGAGELLGEEQSGQIEAVGFSLYTEMLAAAVKALREGREPSLHDLSLDECEIDLRLPALLPPDYIPDPAARLSLYKRLAGCADDNALREFREELIDRYGTLPQGAANLMEVSSLRLLASSLGITRVSGDGRGALIEFGEGNAVDTGYLVSLVAGSRHGEYRLASQSTLRYQIAESESRPRLAILRQLLSAMDGNRAPGK
ncbi:MAG: transcription-repair coupling factor, partial [Succinivibrionaceae bacterium]|nr:transcription-repair coupling factor [Succinivibrionaceae bacterium]